MRRHLPAYARLALKAIPPGPRAHTDRVSIPTPDHHRLARQVPSLEQQMRIDLLLDPATMAPVIPEIECVPELLARGELPRDLQLLVVKPSMLVGVDICEAHPAAVREFKDLQMRKIPASE